MKIALALSLPILAASQSPIICEDTISSQVPFNNNNIPCLLGCGAPIAQATGSLLPGSVNITAIPYCRLDCVRKNATPAQSSAAPACNSKCENGNAATPDQLGWCMYWCVEGGDIENLVVSTTCVPQMEYVPVSTSTIQTNFIVTIEEFTTPPAWASWYRTQTILSRTLLETTASSTGSAMLVSSSAASTPVLTFAPSSSASSGTPSSSAGTEEVQSLSSMSTTVSSTTTSGAASTPVRPWTSRVDIYVVLIVISLSVC